MSAVRVRPRRKGRIVSVRSSLGDDDFVSYVTELISLSQAMSRMSVSVVHLIDPSAANSSISLCDGRARATMSALPLTLSFLPLFCMQDVCACSRTHSCFDANII